MTALYASTLFLSAGLLFMVQPMVAKMLLPLLGGAPSVWNNCMVFFQALLLGGYAYAHWLSTRPPRRAQLLIHLALLLAAVAFLPIRLPQTLLASLSGPRPWPPELWVHAALGLAVGLPFLVLSATAPLLQKWFSQSGHASAADPYFLYVASNAGSLIALLGYPTALEPVLRVMDQTWLWSAGFVLLTFLMLACWDVSFGRAARAECVDLPAPALPPREPAIESRPGDTVTWQRKGRWIALACLPSSLMLGVSTYISTDVAAVPLLWVIPLALYLATFILAFARRELVPRWVLDRAAPIGALAMSFALLTKATQPALMLLALHLAFFFLAALLCHSRLADDRPSTEHLTTFYLCVSIGGVLGGLFNALLAPALFSTVVEYPIAIVLFCWVAECWTKSREPHPRWNRRLLLPGAVGLAAAFLAITLSAMPGLFVQARNGIVFGLPLILAFLLRKAPGSFALSLGAIMLTGLLAPDPHGRTLHVERNFFGISRVTQDPTGAYRRLVHGNTVHGRQFIDPSRQCEPLAYYHRLGPAGQVFQAFESVRNARIPSPVRPVVNVAVVGLGAGALLCYSKPGEAWTVYEIDPAVVRLARNTNYFTYLPKCASARVELLMGDARLRLREAPERRYHIMALDAFSSDAIPLHLLTREALELYLGKLAPGGLLAFHISNRSLDLEPVLGDLAAGLRLECLAQEDDKEPSSDAEQGKENSHWVVMARPGDIPDMLRLDQRWHRVLPRNKPVVWTDDFSNLLSAFRWR